MVSILKNKEDVQSRSSYRGIKLTSHIMKIWERVVRLREETMICGQQYDSTPTKSEHYRCHV